MSSVIENLGAKHGKLLGSLLFSGKTTLGLDSVTLYLEDSSDVTIVIREINVGGVEHYTLQAEQAPPSRARHGLRVGGRISRIALVRRKEAFRAVADSSDIIGKNPRELVVYPTSTAVDGIDVLYALLLTVAKPSVTFAIYVSDYPGFINASLDTRDVDLCAGAGDLIVLAS